MIMTRLGKWPGSRLAWARHGARGLRPQHPAPSHMGSAFRLPGLDVPCSQLDGPRGAAPGSQGASGPRVLGRGRSEQRGGGWRLGDLTKRPGSNPDSTTSLSSRGLSFLLYKVGVHYTMPTAMRQEEAHH